MKLNNKGFAISTVLYGLFALLLLIVMLIFQIMRTGNNNAKDLSEQIEKEYQTCRSKKLTYDSCTGECSSEKHDYEQCLSCARDSTKPGCTP